MTNATQTNENKVIPVSVGIDDAPQYIRSMGIGAGTIMLFALLLDPEYAALLLAAHKDAGKPGCRPGVDFEALGEERIEAESVHNFGKNKSLLVADERFMDESTTGVNAATTARTALLDTNGAASAYFLTSGANKTAVFLVDHTEETTVKLARGSRSFERATVVKPGLAIANIDNTLYAVWFDRGGTIQTRVIAHTKSEITWIGDRTGNALPLALKDGSAVVMTGVNEIENSWGKSGELNATSAFSDSATTGKPIGFRGADGLFASVTTSADGTTAVEYTPANGPKAMPITTALSVASA